MMERTALNSTHRQVAAAAVVIALLLIIGYGWLPSLSTVMVVGLGIVVLAQAAVLWSADAAPAHPQQKAEAGSAPQSLGMELHELSTHIHVTSDGLVRAAQAIQEVASQQSEGAGQQVEVIKLANGLLEDFLKLSERINQQARIMTQTAQEAADISQRGQAALQQAIHGMDDMRTQVGAIGETIVTLATLTRRIDEIITSVSEIATQSNLLALNASIEAARAGVHGRGFSVVADEVRLLSSQSTQAAQQVRAILVEIQNAVKETIRATQTGMQSVDAGVALTQEANNIMVQLSGNVDASHQAVTSIYDVIRQQSGGLEEISVSMDRLDRITQQNLTSVRMAETVSTNLTRLADELQTAVGLSQSLESERVN